jgi:hypothetical protein
MFTSDSYDLALLFAFEALVSRWSVAMHFAPGSAGFVFSSGVSVNGKWRRFTL